ncbi:hypothetical protein MUK42_06729 [Musa troglodytarum]|uniref:Uncharacterized protein n=1 Tax=Musa troglodytarum TaxID=320322 RepID=A0A9E7JGL5_9LILI|nr:hypothetical protein MUK42_06729 [Musa troglodytarum]
MIRSSTSSLIAATSSTWITLMLLAYLSCYLPCLSYQPD